MLFSGGLFGSVYNTEDQITLDGHSSRSAPSALLQTFKSFFIPSALPTEVDEVGVVIVIVIVIVIVFVPSALASTGR